MKTYVRIVVLLAKLLFHTNIYIERCPCGKYGTFALGLCEDCFEHWCEQEAHKERAMLCCE